MALSWEWMEETLVIIAGSIREWNLEDEKDCG